MTASLISEYNQERLMNGFVINSISQNKQKQRSISLKKTTNSMGNLSPNQQIQKQPPSNLIKKQFRKIEIKQNNKKLQKQQPIQNSNQQSKLDQHKQNDKNKDFFKYMNDQIENQPIRLYKQCIKDQKNRQGLPGHFCQECDAFIDAMSLSDIEKLNWCKNCSKHRGWNNVVNQEIDLFKSPF